MTQHTKKAVLTELLEMSTVEVIDQFCAFPGALVDVIENPKWVYVPGTRKDRLLLVAHADTVNDHEKVKVQWVGGVGRVLPECNVGKGYMQKLALGGDDRTGCAALLWLLREHAAYGHSVLITTGEERGCIGARSAATIIGKEHLAKHQFAIEMDRAGARNYVFYSRTSTPAFEAHVAKVLVGWEKAVGSFSDIGAICPEVGICGVNIAAGYLGQHSAEELVILDFWLDSFAVMEAWIQQEGHEKFAWLQPATTVSTPARHTERRSSAIHTHVYEWETACGAMVCSCGEHKSTTWKDNVRQERWYGEASCKACTSLFKKNQETVMHYLQQAETLVKDSKGVLASLHRDAFVWVLDNPGVLSKKMRKRVQKLLLNDKLARAPLVGALPKVTQETVGAKTPKWNCSGCGYPFLFAEKKDVSFCPKCYLNPNAPQLPLPVVGQTGHQCAECKAFVRRDVDHAFSCSLYPGNRFREAM